MKNALASTRDKHLKIMQPTSFKNHSSSCKNGNWKINIFLLYWFKCISQNNCTRCLYNYVLTKFPFASNFRPAVCRWWLSDYHLRLLQLDICHVNHSLIKPLKSLQRRQIRFVTFMEVCRWLLAEDVLGLAEWILHNTTNGLAYKWWSWRMTFATFSL